MLCGDRYETNILCVCAIRVRGSVKIYGSNIRVEYISLFVFKKIKIKKYIFVARAQYVVPIY